MKSWIKRFTQYKFTFMMVPHGASSARQVSIHLSFIIICFVAWTGITFWGSYLSAQHVDYWRTQLSNQVLKMKIQYLMTQLDHSREYLDQVKSIDGQLRDLLKYKNDKSILKNENLLETTPSALGGPVTNDQKEVEQALDDANPDLSWERLIDRVGSLKQEAKARVTSYDDLSNYINGQRKQFKATPRGWPCLGQISSHFGLRTSPFGDGAEEYHPGIDISGTRGAPIRATADGIVRIASWRSGYGNLVVLQHDHGYSTRYGHNTKVVVRVGDRVKRGQTIALMGDTGRASGVHCHYEVWRFSQRMNPYAFLKDETGTATVSKPTPGENPAS